MSVQRVVISEFEQIGESQSVKFFMVALKRGSNILKIGIKLEDVLIRCYTVKLQGLIIH